MKKHILPLCILILFCFTVLLSSCGTADNRTDEESGSAVNTDTTESGSENEDIHSQPDADDMMKFPTEITALERGLSVVSFPDNYYFDDFLLTGAATDNAVMQFLIQNVMPSLMNVSYNGISFACSTVSAAGTDGSMYFGRNFDWNTCDALIVHTTPQNGYASVSTVNLNFISGISTLPDEAKALAAVYAPLDGMNEKGLCVSVNMIQDSTTISQDSGKTDITTTTAVRLLLDKAANTEEATELLADYDLHASMGMMIHFAISDADGNSIVIEYINNEMFVTETPVVTNFYLTPGDKYGIGTAQSHTRYNTLTELIGQKNEFTHEDIRDALDSVSKHNFGGAESTEWSIVFDKTSGIVRYYHRENYNKCWTFDLTEDSQ